MAIFRFSLKHGSRAKNTHAESHANYILRATKYQYGAHELRHSESGNMPAWVERPQDFWKAADKYEAANARLYSEFEITLPRELTPEQQITLTRTFVRQEVGDNHPVTWAIHAPTARDGLSNPHAHVMFTTRSLADGIERGKEVFFKRANRFQPEQGGAPKDRHWMKKERLQALRASWQTHCNRALKQAGSTAAIDHRSLKARGIARAPEPKLTPYETMLWKQGVFLKRVEEVLLLRELAAIEQQAQHRATLQEIENLRRFGARVGERLVEQQTALEFNLSEFQQTSRRIDTLNHRLEHSPTSQRMAYEVAAKRMFESANAAHTLRGYLESINRHILEERLPGK